MSKRRDKLGRTRTPINAATPPKSGPCNRSAPDEPALDGRSPNAVRLLVFDVDGVLTDGSIIVDDEGKESKRFHVRDGFAIKAAMSLGLKIGVITGRSSRSVTLRINDLGIELFAWGQLDKATALDLLAQRAGLTVEEVGYVGDDLIDIPPMLRCGYPMAVADAVEEVRDVACYVTRTHGGRGAAREAIEHVLKSQGRWGELLERYGV